MNIRWHRMMEGRNHWMDLPFNGFLFCEYENFGWFVGIICIDSVGRRWASLHCKAKEPVKLLQRYYKFQLTKQDSYEFYEMSNKLTDVEAKQSLISRLQKYLLIGTVVTQQDLP